MKKNSSVGLSILAMALCFASNVRAEETTMQKAGTAGSETSDAVKKGYRSAKDAACPLVNGKIVCAEKKFKNTARNISDGAKTKLEEQKRKTE